MSIPDLLDKAGEIPESPLTPTGEGLRRTLDSARTEDEKGEIIYGWKMQGFSVQSIAQVAGVHPATIYRWLDKLTEAHRQRMEQRPAANIVVESLHFIDRIKEVCLYEIAQLSGKSEEVEFDKKTGELKRKGNPAIGLKVKYIDAVLKAERLAINLMLDTGIIPREPDKIYHTLKGEKPKESRPDDLRTEEEIREDVWNLLKRARRV